MTQSTVVYTAEAESAEAGTHLGATVANAFDGASPHVVIVFASSRYDYRTLLKALETACRPELLVGCSSAGEFINHHQGEHAACAIAVRSDEIQFAAGLGQHLRTDLRQASRDIATSFTGINAEPALFHSALVLTDALAGYADDLIEQLTVLTGGTYRFFGGGAGDDAQFSQTHVFYGTEAYTDAAVALEIISQKPLGVGVQHGWSPASEPFRVTETDGMRLVSLNAAPAVEVFEEYARATGQRFNPQDPLPFFLHNVIGINSGNGYKLRVPLAVNEDGSINCAADIPEGATVYLMRATSGSASEAAAAAARRAVEQLQGNRPEVAIFFDCVATRLRMGDEFGLELRALEEALGAANYAGCNTYGQIARAEGQFSGFHNCTAVVCVIPG